MALAAPANPAPAPDARSFRDALGRFATGVAFVTATGKPGRGGVPLITDALASLECEMFAEHPAGDHWIVVGQVDNMRIPAIKDPLVFFAGAFGALQERT